MSEFMKVIRTKELSNVLGSLLYIKTLFIYMFVPYRIKVLTTCGALPRSSTCASTRAQLIDVNGAGDYFMTRYKFTCLQLTL